MKEKILLFIATGPYVVIFSNVVDDILKWIVLNASIFILFTCAFWIGFGANSDHPANGYNTTSPLLYNMFQMMIVGDFKYAALEKANPKMARILCGIFLLTAAIITLNLLIALVTNTFERLYENAVENAIMQRARTILLLQSRMGKKKRRRYYEYIKTHASPQIIQNKYGRLMTKPYEDRATIDRVYDDVRQIKNVLAERFGKRYGRGNKSDIDIFREDLGRVKRYTKELSQDIKNVKLILYGMGGQPVSPVRKSVGSRMSSTELLKKSRGDENGNVDGNDNNNNNNYSGGRNNNTTNNNSTNNSRVNNNTTSNTFQPFPVDIQRQQTENHTFPLAPILQSYLENLSYPKAGKKRNSARRSSKKPEPSSKEDSDSDDIFVPSTPPKFTKSNSHRWKKLQEGKKQGPFSKRGKAQREEDERLWKGNIYNY